MSSIDESRAKVKELLKQRPMSLQELARSLGLKSKQTLRRMILKPMETEGDIEKVQGTNKYQLRGFKATIKSIAVSLASLDEVDSCEVIKNWRFGNKGKERESFIERFKLLCLGQITNKAQPDKKINFKINPDGWNHPSDTEKCIKALQAFYDTEELEYNIRMVLRYFIQYGLKYSLTQAEADRLGIGGHTVEPTLSDLHLPDPAYDSIKSNQSIPKYFRALFIVHYWTFCRTSTRYTIKIDDFTFYDRTVEYVEYEGDKISEKKAVRAMKAAGYKSVIQTHRAASLKVHEFKTDKTYPKYIWDGDFVEELEKYVASRKAQGFKYLFWDNNKTIFTKDNYNKVVSYKRNQDNKKFKEIFIEAGMKRENFGKKFDANYAIRHFGVQEWLIATNYDYGKIILMGWEDINTLIKWYGQRPEGQVAKEFGEIIF